jgi:hypothetical protein
MSGFIKPRVQDENQAKLAMNFESGFLPGKTYGYAASTF